MTGYAALSWYELPETGAIHDRLWAALARHLEAAGVSPVPPSLIRPVDPHEALARDDLTLTQICGYVTGGVGRDRVVPVAALRYDSPDCEGSRYRALVVVRASSGIERFDDLAGARAVINDPLSHTGCNALRTRVTRVTRDRFFGSIAVSGAHEKSAGAVREDRADVAAIDCITWALLARYRPSALDGLAVLERLPLAPSPPLVTGRAFADQLPAMRHALAAFFADPATAADRAGLLWAGYELVDPAVYAELIPDQTRVAGFEFDERY